MKKDYGLHIIAVWAFVVLIVLGLACATTQSVPITYTEPGRLNMSGINKIAIDSNNDHVTSEISRRLASKYTVASPEELQAWKEWRELAAYQAPATEVKSTDLVKTYLDNAVRADTLYANKMLKTSGVVKEIGKSSRGSYFAHLSVGNDAVDVYFLSSQLDKLGSVNKGNTITIVGKCVGFNLPNMEDTAEILRILGAGKSVNIINAIFPIADYTGSVDAVVSVSRDFQAQDTYETKQKTENYTDSEGKLRTRTFNVTVYYRVGTLRLDYQIMRSRDFSIIGAGVKSQTSNKYSSEYSELPSRDSIAAALVNPLVELAGEMVPTERTISITLQKEENNKEAKKEMSEAEKFVKAKDYKNAVSTYGNIYAKYNNFAAGYNHAVLMEATEGTAAAVELMAALANQTNESLAKTTLTEMQQRNNANQQAMQQLSK